MKHLFILLAALLPPPAFASEPNIAKKEIEHLVAHLGSSGCQFNRNGSWHTSQSAVAHLKRKYDYLLKRNLAPTAEAFIERAASESSASGKPYLVKCGDAPAVPSAQWLRQELERYRSSHMEYELDPAKATGNLRKHGALIPTKGKTRITIYIDDAVLENFRS